MVYRTKEQWAEAVANSTSVAGVCRLLGLVARGGNYKTVKKHIDLHELDVTHFTGQGWNRGRYSASPISRSTLKQKLIRERGHICERCQNSIWQSCPIPLELEHIDADSTNNLESNLLLLCPNCHALTPTWKRGIKGLK